MSKTVIDRLPTRPSAAHWNRSFSGVRVDDTGQQPHGLPASGSFHRPRTGTPDPKLTVKVLVSPPASRRSAANSALPSAKPLKASDRKPATLQRQAYSGGRLCSNMLTSSTLCVSQAVAAEARLQLSRLLVGHHDEPATVESQRGWRADRLIADLAAYLRRADAQGTLNIRAPTSSGGPIPVDVPRRWPHPRADDARRARRAGRQGAAA